MSTKNQRLIYTSVFINFKHFQRKQKQKVKKEIKVYLFPEIDHDAYKKLRIFQF